LFYKYVHYRDLPSFPTRRSSDLVQMQDVRHLGARRSRRFRSGRELRSTAIECGLDASHGGVDELADLLERVIEDILQKDARALLDRKSTRLNSSHRTISYAVFCL